MEQLTKRNCNYIVYETAHLAQLQLHETAHIAQLQLHETAYM